MKIKPFWIIVLLIVSSGCLITACKKDTAPTNNNSIPLATAIISDTSLKLFVEVLQRSNNINLLAKPDSLTILALDNNAFIAAGLTDSVIRSLPAATLDIIARYHVIPSSIQLIPGASTPYTTVLGTPVYGFTNSDGSLISFNGVVASKKQNIQGTNAAVYRLSAPLTASSDSLATVFLTDSTISFFALALTRANIVISSSSPTTVLIPDNNAFINAGYPDTASINNADSTTLSNILLYHMLPGLYFTSDFAGVTTVNTLQGSAVNVSFSSNILQFTGNGNTGPALATTAATVSGNNLIFYKINGLLLP